MKLFKLNLTEGQKRVLYHPCLGEVLWNEIHGPGSGFCLSFLLTGELLMVDNTVLNDDEWEISKE